MYEVNAKKSATTRTRRVRMNKYRVWFKDGTSAVVEAEYPNKVYDQLPVALRMKIDRIVDDI